MPELPRTVQIGPFTYSIKRIPKLENREFDGKISCSELEIEIVEELPDQKVGEVLLHEILHGCWDASALPDKAAEEQAISGLAIQLVQVIRDNPDLVPLIAALVTCKP